MFRAERARRDFSLFIRDAWPELEPDTPLLWNWHIDALAIHLQALYEREITRLVIGIAPGHAKSTIISQLFPVWCWINDPYSRWLCASHSMDLAIRDNGIRRRLIESEWFQQNYGDVFSLAKDQNMKSFYQNDKKGHMVAVSVGGSGTGKRGTHLLIDDPNNAMDGQADLAATREWFGKTWMSRLNDRKNGPMVVVGQRLGEDDLIGHILKLGGWEHLCLPEEFETARRSVTKIGWTDPRQEEGELLWPELFPREVLDELKLGLGSMNYAAQFQQSPVPASGGQFKQQWLRYFYQEDNYYVLERPEGMKRFLVESCQLFATADLAISEKETADYSVFCVWAITPDKDLLLIERIRAHFDNPEQQKQLRKLYDRFGLSFLLIESVAYQLALVQQLRKDGLPVREYKPRGKGDKVARATTAAVLYENGQVYHPKHAIWLHEWESEILMFPMSTKKDQVDNASMAADVLAGPQKSPEQHLDDLRQRVTRLQQLQGAMR